MVLHQPGAGPVTGIEVRVPFLPVLLQEPASGESLGIMGQVR
ncbi:MAG: hypothetical protein ACK559_17170 [bacterium]